MGGGKGLFTARESLVNDIPAGYGKTVNLFYSVLSSEIDVAESISIR